MSTILSFNVKNDNLFNVWCLCLVAREPAGNGGGLFGGCGRWTDQIAEEETEHIFTL